MPTSKEVLLVEGRSDEEFFSEFCKTIGLSPSVLVAPPRAVGGKANNKEGVFNHLPILLNQFADGRITRLAAVVDADYLSNDGLGYQKTTQRFTEIVEKFGFRQRDPVRKLDGGLMFESQDGFSDVGLWVMPGTQTDGMLEHWVKSCVHASDMLLLLEAEKAVKSLKDKKFPSLHNIKAEVATWLAWQKAPGRGMESSIKDGLLDPSSKQYIMLSEWLKNVFA